MMLWLAHFCPTRIGPRSSSARALEALERLWREEGYFGRASKAPTVRIAFANYGVSVGLQSWNQWPERVEALNAYFDRYRSGDEYDREAITWVMACSSHLPGALLSQRVADAVI
jgi:hypothetical protein